MDKFAIVTGQAEKTPNSVSGCGERPIRDGGDLAELLFHTRLGQRVPKKVDFLLE